MMFDAIRNNKRISQIILGILIIPFAFFGIERYFSDGPGGKEIAEVGKIKIRSVEFENFLRQQQNELRNRGADSSLYESPLFRKQTLENLINQKVFELYAEDNRLVVTSNQLREVIASIPAFQIDGVFSNARYEQMVRAQGDSKASFEYLLAKDLTNQQIIYPIAGTAFVAESSALQLLQAELETRDVDQLEFMASDFLNGIELPDDAARMYYNGNLARFERPARVKADYVVFDVNAFKEHVQPTDEAITAYYQQNASDFGQPEQRKVRHILIEAPADASEQELADAQAKVTAAMERLQANPDEFAEVAKLISQDPESAEKGGELDYFFARGEMVPEFDDAAFSQPKGEIGEPVRSQYGFHIIQVMDIRPASLRPLEDVRDQIVDALRTREAERMFAENADEFSNMVFEQSDSLAPVLEHFKLDIHQSDWIDRGTSRVGALDSPALVSALFSDDAILNKRNTDVINLGDNVLVAAHVTEYEPAKRLPFDEVKDDIEKQLRFEAGIQKAEAHGQSVLQSLQSGQTPEGVEWNKIGKITRNYSLSPDARKAVFSAPSNEMPVYAGVLDQDAYYIYRVNAVEHPAIEADDQRIAFISSNYQQRLANQDFAAFLSSLRDHYGVKIYQMEETEE